MKKASLLWIDLEMTGLDEKKDKILEVAIIATDWKLNEIARYESAVKASPLLLKKRMVGEFWEQNSATRDALIEQNKTAPTSDKVESEIISFIEKHCNLKKPIYLAGNSIWNDRKFIAIEWQKLDKSLHYRMLDVSAWKIVFENMIGTKFAKPENHRAMEDIEGSIAELKIYLDKIKK